MGENAESKASFASVMEHLAASMVKKAEVDPVLKVSVLESYAKRMTSYGYEFTPKTLKVLADYLKGYNLMLCGQVGLGKTFFFECMSKVRLSMNYGAIEKLSMVETQVWTLDMVREWVDETRNSDIVIDDLGTESSKMVNFGQEYSLFPYLLEKRMQLSHRRTHVTSNYDAKELMAKYGQRVGDRFIQMFKEEIFAPRRSRRVSRPWKSGPKDGGGVP